MHMKLRGPMEKLMDYIVTAQMTVIKLCTQRSKIYFVKFKKNYSL